MSFYEMVNIECKKKGFTVTELLRRIDMTSANTGAWKSGGYPKVDKLIKISDILDVSIDYLLGREETKKESTVIANKNKNPEIQQIIHKLTTVEIPDDVIEFINNALDKYTK